MSEDKSFFDFTNEEDFNKITSSVHDNAFAEFQRFATHFETMTKQSGPDCFPPTLTIYNSEKEFVGVITSRDTEDKDDLYCAMAEMLYFPTSISSALFIVANDVRIKKVDNTLDQLDFDSQSQDALVVTYVTSENCIVYTCPYSLDQDNNVTWLYQDSFISKVATSNDDLPIGNMIELFFIFSHTDSPGPFSPDEVLHYLNSKNFTFKIFHPERISSKTKHIIGL